MDAPSDSSRWYGALVEAAPDVILVVDGSGRIVLANRRAEAVLGWAPHELVGRPIEDLIPPRFRTAHLADREGFAKRPRRREMGSGRELFARRRDGSDLAVEVSLSPLHEDGAPEVCCIVRDVTDRKLAEAQKQRVWHHLESAVESIQGAFALFDAEDRLVMCNSTYRELLAAAIVGPVVGLSYEQLLDRALGDRVFDDGGDPVGLRERLLLQHRSPSSPIDVVTRDGRNLRVIDRPTPEGGRVSELWDLSEDVQREAELRRMREVAEAASAAKTDFLSSMSHELRTPLNAILGFAQLLRRDRRRPLDERQRSMVEHVLRGGEHLLRLIDEILDLSRIEAGGSAIACEPVALAEVLEEVIAALGPSAMRAAVTLALHEVPADGAIVIADRMRVAQILMNYVSNAIKYGRAGGSVALRTALGDDRAVRVTVTDDGIGIPAEMHDRIFQPFQRAGQERGPIEGTGIGLAISKRLAERMGGRVGFVSAPERGSVFWVELPAPTTDDALVPDASGSTAYSPSPTADGRSLEVIYVEDNASNVAFMRALLAELAGIELRIAASAEIGLELVRARRPDVVLMDINLPGMSGYEALQRLRASPGTRQLPVIALSASAMPVDRARAEAAGFLHYLTKPVDIDELTATLESVRTEMLPLRSGG